MKEYVGIYIKGFKTENAQKQSWDSDLLCCIHYYWCIIIASCTIEIIIKLIW